MGLTTTVDPLKISSDVLSKYTLADNTFSRVEKADVKDKIEVEIGDALQADFYPQVKLKRWDNEVNFSARLSDDDIETPVVSGAEGKILWDKAKIAAHFYQVLPSELFPEGGYELEIYLKSKPKTNVITFTLQHKGLKFLHQPELTVEQIAAGYTRPDHIVNSYAVYYDNPPSNIEGGKIYRTGKAFHIYRPRIEDANGDWVWGELSIDPINNLMTVTIPQTFINKGIYPLRHASGSTFGYTTLGSTQHAFVTLDSLFAKVGTTGGSGGVINSITFAAYLNSGSAVAKGAVYSDGGVGYPVSVITPVSAEVSVTRTYATLDWETGTITSGATLSASTTYWAVISVGSITNRFIMVLDTSSEAETGADGTDVYDTWPPDTAWTTSTDKFSIYATYSAASAPTMSNTDAVNNIGYTTAYSGGSVTSDGGSTVTRYGICWNTGGSPTTADSVTYVDADPGGSGFSLQMTGLSANTHYHVRCYAVNGVGTSYGSDVNFTTNAYAVPTVSTTTPPSTVGTTTATCAGNVSSDGGVTVTEKGVCYIAGAGTPTTANSKGSTGSGTGAISSNLTGLSEGTLYSYRAYAINTEGTGYGSTYTFTTNTSTAIQTIKGLAKASVSVVNGLAIASMKNWNGLS